MDTTNIKPKICPNPGSKADPEEARWRLARLIYDTIERLDPADTPPSDKTGRRYFLFPYWSLALLVALAPISNHRRRGGCCFSTSTSVLIAWISSFMPLRNNRIPDSISLMRRCMPSRVSPIVAAKS